MEISNFLWHPAHEIRASRHRMWTMAATTILSIWRFSTFCRIFRSAAFSAVHWRASPQLIAVGGYTAVQSSCNIMVAAPFLFERLYDTSFVQALMLSSFAFCVICVSMIVFHSVESFLSEDCGVGALFYQTYSTLRSFLCVQFHFTINHLEMYIRLAIALATHLFINSCLRAG